ncbi:MAG: sensor domain-containing diguanylate cyclase [Armatimonadota bacterium]
MFEGNDFFHEVVENLFDGVYVVDLQRKIVFWNRGAWMITGFTSEEVVGARCADNILMHVTETGEGVCCGMCPLSATLRDGQPREVDLFLHHKQGHRLPVSIRISPLRDAEGTIIGAVEVFNVNAGKAAALEKIKELENLAFMDSLTRIANRRYLELSLQAHLNEAGRYRWPFGVLFLDIDHFKAVNDHYGHDIGDQVLRMVANTLAASTRSFDLIGRWGGEEFVAVISNADAAQVEAVAQRYRALVEQSFLMVGEAQMRVTVSIGGTLAYPGDDIDSLIKRADQLMYRSKELGRNCVSLDAGMMELLPA